MYQCISGSNGLELVNAPVTVEHEKHLTRSPEPV